MFNREKLKENAKIIMKSNYWLVVVITLILGISLGTSSTPNFNVNFNQLFGINNTDNNDTTFEDIFNDENLQNGFFDDEILIEDDFSAEEFKNIILGAAAIALPIMVIIFFVVFIITYCLFTFALNPLQIGCRKWFLNNRTEKPKFIELVSGFRYNYWNVVKVMFVRDIKITLWSLLFVIPGIIKSYEYRMVPYLLAENPNMSTKDALEASKKLMYGNKMEAWVLDLSFIGWRLLSVLTCGVLSIFYVEPYIALTDTELYVCLCQGNENYGKVEEIGE